MVLSKFEFDWNDSYISCKSDKMNLAIVEPGKETDNLLSIVRKNSKIFREKIYFGRSGAENWVRALLFLSHT